MSSSRKPAPAREPLDINLDCKEYVLSGDPDNIAARGESSRSRWTRSSGESSASRLSRIASAVLTSWTTATLPAEISVSIASKTVGIFIEMSKADQKRCLELSNRLSADPFAIAFKVRPEARSTILAALSAASTLR